MRVQRPSNLRGGRVHESQKMLRKQSSIGKTGTDERVTRVIKVPRLWGKAYVLGNKGGRVEHFAAKKPETFNLRKTGTSGYSERAARRGGCEQRAVDYLNYSKHNGQGRSEAHWVSPGLAASEQNKGTYHEGIDDTEGQQSLSKADLKCGKKVTGQANPQTPLTRTLHSMGEKTKVETVLLDFERDLEEKKLHSHTLIVGPS